MDTEETTAEARLQELYREAQSMLEGARAVREDFPGWERHHKLEWITEKQADRLYWDWLTLQVQRHAERPDLYAKVPSHNGRLIRHALAYCAEKKVRLREIQAEVREIRERFPSPRVAEVADNVESVCEWLEEAYDEASAGPTYRPPKRRGLT